MGTKIHYKGCLIKEKQEKYITTGASGKGAMAIYYWFFYVYENGNFVTKTCSLIEARNIIDKLKED